MQTCRHLRPMPITLEAMIYHKASRLMLVIYNRAYSHLTPGHYDVFFVLGRIIFSNNVNLIIENSTL